jgi:hypothetical protein
MRFSHSLKAKLFFVSLCHRRLKSKNYQKHTQASYVNILPGKNKLRTVAYTIKNV